MDGSDSYWHRHSLGWLGSWYAAYGSGSGDDSGGVKAIVHIRLDGVWSNEGGASAPTHHPPNPRPYNMPFAPLCRGGRGWDGWWGRLRRPRSLYAPPIVQ